MTKTFRIVITVLALLLLIVPFGLLVVFNIVHPEIMGNEPRARVLTVVYIICCYILIPYVLLRSEDSDELSELFTFSFIIPVIALLILWKGAGWKNFWGTFWKSAHSGWDIFSFYFTLTATWIFNAMILIFLLADDHDLYGRRAEEMALRVAKKTPFRSTLRRLAEEDESEEVRKVSIDRLEDQRDLEHVLLWGRYAGSRAAAVKKLENRKILCDIAEHDEDLNVRVAAVRRISDQDVLSRIVLNERNPLVSAAALERLSGAPEVIAEMAGNAKEVSIRKIAAEKMDDPELSAQMILKEPSDQVRIILIGKVTDPDVLLKVAENDSSITIRKKALEKISGADALQQVALNNSDESVRLCALERVSDQVTLRRAALNDPSSKNRIEAVKRLNDRDAVAMITITDADEGVRNAALLKTDSEDLEKAVLKTKEDVIYFPKERIPDVSDQAVLIKLGEKGCDSAVRKAAISRITDEETLKKFVQNSPESEIRVCALTEINDRPFLVQTAQEDNAPEVRKAAVMKIDERDVLTRIVKHDKNPGVQIEAFKKTDDETLNRWVILNSESVPVLEEAVDRTQDPEARLIGFEKILKYGSPVEREKAVGKIEDRNLLIQTAKHDPDTKVRLKALKKAEDDALMRWIIFNSSEVPLLEAAASRTKDIQARVLGYEKILQETPRDVHTADRLRDLYKRNNLARRIYEQHSDVHEDNNENAYCCYSDYSDYSDITYSVEKL